MKIREKIYDIVIYNRQIKQIAMFLLKSPFIAKDPAYNFFYNRLMRKKMHIFKDVPFRVMMENTNICNADCVFCPHKSMKRMSGTMDLELSKKIIEECAKLGIRYLTIYGFGEPLLDRFFFERVKCAKGAGIPRVTTNTNAMYLSEDNIAKILNSGLDEIYISFDAAREVTFSKIRPNLNFNTVKLNILKLLKEKKNKGKISPKIFLSFVESHINSKEVSSYLKEWKDKTDGISISLTHNWTGSIAKMNKEFSNLKRDPCRLLWTDMVISWNGDVPLCCNDFENRIILGNVKHSSIKEIWGGEKLSQIRKAHMKGDFNLIPICKECEYNFHFKSPWWVAK